MRRNVNPTNFPSHLLSRYTLGPVSFWGVKSKDSFNTQDRNEHLKDIMHNAPSVFLPPLLKIPNNNQIPFLAKEISDQNKDSVKD